MKTFNIRGRTLRVREREESEYPKNWPLTSDVECLSCGAEPGKPCTGMISASRHDDDVHHFTREWDASEIHKWLEGKAVALNDSHQVMGGKKIMHPIK